MPGRVSLEARSDEFGVTLMEISMPVFVQRLKAKMKLDSKLPSAQSEDRASLSQADSRLLIAG